ncbi:hypothetical protein [Streptomyces antimycoticus]|uniref:hypothetical protein n=1 Tax=Streptomyces antimycoticus TaxID=68175 RepID=UPI0033EEB51D
MGISCLSTRRTVLIVLLSHDSRTILLDQSTSTATWWPLRLDVPRGSSSAKVMRRWQRQDTALRNLHRGGVTGYLTTTASSPAGPTTQKYRVMIFKLSEPTTPGSVPPSAQWWPITQLKQATLFPRELGLFMEGYVEGWIPDGRITLDN